MRIDLPLCDFQNCRKRFDGNCTDSHYEICEYKMLKEDADKYRWHDLRKNPDDLPKDGLDIVVWNSGADKFSMTASPYWVRNCANDSGYNIVAWKEIEPFESEV